MIVCVATIQRGRAGRLQRQREALARGSMLPAAHVVVSMDPDPGAIASQDADPGEVAAPLDVVPLPVPDGAPLPLAEARNVAVQRAHAAHGADAVVLLDVDCLPALRTIERYAAVAAQRPEAVLAGVVRYLPPGVPAGGGLPTAEEVDATPPHPARPSPAAHELVTVERPELLWSLSLCLSPAVHASVGGFDAAYVGYGAEDTDFALRLREAGVPMLWVGGAEAWHVHHPVSSPPVEHLEDIARNARTFHARWGRWPMEGWLEAFAEQGLVDWTSEGSTLVIRTQPRRYRRPDGRDRCP